MAHALLLAMSLLFCCQFGNLNADELPSSFDEHRFYQQYHALSNEVVTPHLTWSKPSVWSDLRVLVIAPSWGQRETVELQQRFDFQISSLMTLRHNAFAGLTSIGSPLSPDQVTSYFERDLLEKQYDVIVISRTEWRLFPSQYRYDILNKVYQEGCGLLLINTGKHQELDQLFAKTAWKPDFGFANLEALGYVRNGNVPKTKIAGVVFGKGRVLRLDWRAMSAQMILTPWQGNYDFDWEYDHYLAITAKAILACAGKFQDVLQAPEQVINLQSGLGGQMLSFPIAKENSIPAKTLELLAFSEHVPQGHQLAMLTNPSDHFSGTIEAGLPAGAYVLLAVSRDESGRVCSWQTFPLQVTSPCRISSLSLPKDAFAKAGDRIEVKVQLEGAFNAEVPLLAEVYDINGRLVLQQKIPYSDAAEQTFHFPAPYPLSSCLFRLKLSLGNWSTQSCSFTVQGRERPAFSFGAWVESQACYISYRFYQSMAANGIDGIFYSNARGDRKVAAPLLAKTGLFSIPEFYYYKPNRNKSNPEAPVNRNNLNDPEFLAEQRRKMQELAQVWAKYDVHCYTDGSDKSRGGNSFDPLSKETFRNWMQNRYKSIQALNAKLGTSFQTFAELDPQPLEMSRANGNLPLWIEYNRFFEERFLNYFKEMLQVAKDADLNGEAWLGPDGFGRLDPFEFSGMYQLLKTVNYYNLYTYQDPPQMEIGRSLLQYCPQVKFRTIYAGSYGNQYMNYVFMRTIPWYMLFHDYTGFFWYMGNGKLTYSSEGCMAFMPDLRPSEGFQVAAKQIAELRRGLAPLVAASKRQHDQIAILYCNTSVAAATVRKQENTLRRSLSVLQQLLEDSGLQYDYLPPEEMENGSWKQNYRVLFLPFALSLSQSTLASIEEFVKDGGLVIADCVPGEFDDVLRPGPAKMLEGRFQPESGSWRLYDWKTYSKVRKNQKQGTEARQQLLALLSGYRTSRTQLHGGGIVEVEKIEYQLPSGGLLIALLNYQPESRELTLGLPAGKVLYDLRGAGKIGVADSHTLLLPGGEVKIFALLDAELPALELEKPDAVLRGGLGAFRLRNGKQSNAYHLQFFDAAGKERREYAKTLLSGEEYLLRPALNDPVGTWQVQAKDTISGQLHQAEFIVKPAQ